MDQTCTAQSRASNTDSAPRLTHVLVLVLTQLQELVLVLVLVQELVPVSELLREVVQ